MVPPETPGTTSASPMTPPRQRVPKGPTRARRVSLPGSGVGGEDAVRAPSGTPAKLARAAVPGRRATRASEPLGGHLGGTPPETMLLGIWSPLEGLLSVLQLLRLV